MRVLHISEYCHAATIGGTERYLLDLIRGLQARGISNRIGWISNDVRRLFSVSGVEVQPLPSPIMRVDEPPPQLEPVSRALLEEFKPSVVHFHTFGLAEAAIARLAGEYRIPYLFTYHSPGWACRREDLLIWGGSQPCDGEVRTLRCAACKVQERIGGPKLGGYAGALLSAPLDWMFRGSGKVNFRRRVCFVSDTRRYRRALRQFLGACSLAVSCSEWGVPILMANGAKPERVKMIPQGVPSDFVSAAKEISSSRERPAEWPFTIGYIGRVTRVKGVEILAEGFSRVFGSDLKLQIYGYVAGEKTVGELNRKLETLARRDTRIELHPKLALQEIAEKYQRLDLVAIPSVTLETGPLVLFEALQMRVPVFGSNRLGHLGLLKENGMVVEPNTPAGWQQALVAAIGEFRNGLWNRRRENIAVGRKLQIMDDIAGEMEKEIRRLEAEN